MPDITTYATATIARQLKGINDAIIDRNTLSSWMKKKGRIKTGLGGDSIKWRVYTSEPVIFGSTTDTGSRTAQTIQPITTAEVRYCQYDGEIAMFTFQLQRNKNADETSKMFDQMMEELNIFKQSAQAHLGRHMYGLAATTLSSDRGTNIAGLQDIVPSTSTNTYAGIARSTETYWRNQVATASSPELDTDGNDVPELLESMRSLLLDCAGGAQADANGHIGTEQASNREEPDAIFTTKAIFLNYENCLTPQQRYTSTSARDPQAELLFNNLPINWDNFCLAGKLYMLNSKFLEINACGDALIEAPSELQGVLVPGRNAKTWSLLGQFQMLSRNPRYHGVLTVS
jgi:hypothetical protein